jgi:pimeloyl-ACP methyl ester carboxylesterase
MIVLIVFGIVAMLAAVTFMGTRTIESAHPPSGRFVDVGGGRLHVVELGSPAAPPLLLLHGASGNLGDLRLALGDALAARYRVILVDRPGHGWSDNPGGRADSSPARQAEIIHQAMLMLGIKRPVVIGHSWSGALATAYALAYPDDVSGLVLLAPVTHPWRGGVGTINQIAAMPVVGPLFAHIAVLPAGYFLVPGGIASVFAPRLPPPDYREKAAADLILRPAEFIANARDLVGLKDFVTAQYPHYGEIIASEDDTIVSTAIHARAIARQVPHGKLIVLKDAGHMIQFTATDIVVKAVDDVMARQRP